jgi:superfamily II DNA or RNA helicase
MKLIPELFTAGLFTLLTAPVAKGKTKLIVDYYRDNQVRMVFVSPLRALANEVYSKLKEEKSTYILGGEVGRDEVCIDFLQKKKAFLVTTMELLSEEFLEAIADSAIPTLFILDEFHLFYHWGESFRPILHDRFLAILNSDSAVLGMTATMSEDLTLKLTHDLAYHCESWIHIDYGNHQLHREPFKLNSFIGFSKNKLERVFAREMSLKNNDEVFLFFCSYRSEVDEKVQWARRQGYRALGCVGGEVERFLSELHQSDGKIDCIFSTTTLSHGVNLPEIKKVFINYEVKNYDFWLQMIGRGGRRGSDYNVYTFDAFHLSKKELLKNKLKIYLSDFVGLEM